MAVFRPFSAYRPEKKLAEKVAALPYDVMSSDEAKEMVKGNPYSFLHVDKAEIDFTCPINKYEKCVYQKAADNLHQMIKDHIYIHDDKPCYYIYRQIMDGRSQAGVVGCASIDDYLNDRIKKHELTVAKKEEDRVCHVDACNANTGPIFLTYRNKKEVTSIMEEWMDSHTAEYDFVSEDGISHTIWVIDDEMIIAILENAFDAIPAFYIADGHHRAASAVRVGLKRRNENPDFNGNEEFNFFLSVLFPDNQLSILDYNRVLKDWNGYTPQTLLKKLEEQFIVEKSDHRRVRPDKQHTFGMYMDHTWYYLTAKDNLYQEPHQVDNLDVSLLQKYVLTPIFDIEDPRTDSRIAFVGGIRGLSELERMVDGGMAVAFSMYPTSVEELMNIADEGDIMPPKSTWFEPKLRSGIFVHELE